MKATRAGAIALMGSGLIMSALACALPSPQAVNVQGTLAAQTVEAVLSLTAAAGGAVSTPTPLIGATVTPLGSATVAADTATPVEATPTEGACGTNLAVFVADVTVPDDTPFQPRTAFTKTWRLQNAGTCAWNTEYALVFDHGDPLGAPVEVLLLGEVPPRAAVDLSVNLVAPATPGTYSSFWKLRTDAGVEFGVGAGGNTAFFVRIVVPGTPTTTPTATTTGTPTSTPTASASPTASSTPTATIPPINWTATYTTRLEPDESPMYVGQSGSSIASDPTIGAVAYHLVGTVSADTLTVTGTFTGGGLSGTFFWRMDSVGNQFSGRWVNSADNSVKAWCGARNGAPLPTTCLANP